MNPVWPEIEDWLDLLGNLWIGIVVILAAGVPSWMSARTHSSLKQETKVIRDQLVNGHKTFLRSDMDKALAAIETLSYEIATLRKELFLETDSRRSQIDDLRGDVDRMRRR